MCRKNLHARLLILRKIILLCGLILVCMFIVFEKKKTLHVYYILLVYSISRVPGLTRVFIRKTHFLPPEIQIKDPFFPIVILNENNWDSKYNNWFCVYYLRPVHLFWNIAKFQIGDRKISFWFIFQKSDRKFLLRFFKKVIEKFSFGCCQKVTEFFYMDVLKKVIIFKQPKWNFSITFLKTLRKMRQNEIFLSPFWKFGNVSK